MESLRVNDKDIKKAIQLGNRKFLLFEAEDVSNNDGYEVSDPLEKQKLLAALNDDNPLLSEEEINVMLGDGGLLEKVSDRLLIGNRSLESNY